MAVTPNYNWPVPVATDYVKDGWEAISDLGNAIDTTVAGLGSGLTLIKTQSIGSAVSSVTVSDAFNTNFSNYKILVNSSVNSTTTGMRMTLGATSSGYYGNQFGTGWSNVVIGSGSTTYSFWEVGAGSTGGTFVNIDLLNPFASANTAAIFSYMTTSYGFVGTGLLNNSTSYTAFTLTCGAGTLTGGTISVFGYQK